MAQLLAVSLPGTGTSRSRQAKSASRFPRLTAMALRLPVLPDV
ncbi:hypothetical protein SGLAM104S_02767 [Streptomyces glaucescens]